MRYASEDAANGKHDPKRALPSVCLSLEFRNFFVNMSYLVRKSFNPLLKTSQCYLYCFSHLSTSIDAALDADGC